MYVQILYDLTIPNTNVQDQHIYENRIAVHVWDK